MTGHITRATLLAWLASGLATPATAADLLVEPFSDFTTIQGAVDAAQDGDRILVVPGTYDETVYLLSRQLTIERAGPLGEVVILSPYPFPVGLAVVEITGNPADMTLRNVVIDGSFQDRGLVVSNGAHAVLDGVTVRQGVNPDGYPGGGLDVFGGASVIAQNTTFQGNQAFTAPQPWGGNVAVEDTSTLELGEGTQVLSGFAERGGGLWVGGQASVGVWRSDFQLNTAQAPYDADGGGICAESGAALRVEESSFSSNVAGMDDVSYGGGIYAADTVLTVRDTTFDGNSAHLGGGLGVERGSLVSWGNTFDANSADKGAAIGCDSGFLCGVLSTGFESNTAGAGGAIYGWSSVFTIGGSGFCNNQSAYGLAADADGGAIRLQRGGLTVFNTVFAQNSAAENGGAIGVSDAVVASTNNHYIGNDAVLLGGAFHGVDTLGWFPGADSVNDLFHGNVASSAGAVRHGPGVANSVEYAWFSENVPDHGTITASPTNFVDAGDPLLSGWTENAPCDPSLWVPQPGSPLVDAGSPMHTDLDGSPSDIGAFGGDRYAENAEDDQDLDGIPSAFDCNDNDPTVGLPDRWFLDDDGDTFGNPVVWADDCTQPAGFVEDDTDCDDTDPAIHPLTAWFPDADGDGWGDGALGVQACDPEGHVLNPDDCDDGDPTVGPPGGWFFDEDGDGWGSEEWLECAPLADMVDRGGDCDDTTPKVNPDASETCNGRDDDCNDLVDDGASDGVVGYRDADGDGFGAGEEVLGCDGEGLALASGDCDDSDPAVNPGATEQPDDDLDNDCDGIEARSWIAGGGCACDQGPADAPPAALLLLLLGPRRRRGAS